MQIKRFEARTMTTALRLIKDELGPNAVILSARNLKRPGKIFGAMHNVGVVVTAAIDTDNVNLQKRIRRAAGKNQSKAHATSTDKQASSTEKSDGRSLRSGKSSKTASRNSTGGKSTLSGGRRAASAALLTLLRSQEVSAGLAEDFCTICDRLPAAPDRSGGPADIKARLVAFLEQNGAVADTGAAGKKPEILALVGTPGVGKTATVAKLAVRQICGRNRRIALISLDNQRIAAREELKVYARIIGVPLEFAPSPAELKTAIQKYKDRDRILIDTPGVNPGDRAGINALKLYFEKLRTCRIHLLLSAATKENDLFEITESLRQFPVSRLLFTKLDETGTYGTIVNLLIRTKIPLSYVTDGQDIFDGIEKGALEKIVARLLGRQTVGAHFGSLLPAFKQGKASLAPNHQADRIFYVANKNSDVYHKTGCKWVNKIKPRNMIRFETASAAEKKGFAPCRNCCSERFEVFNDFARSDVEKQVSCYR